MRLSPRLTAALLGMLLAAGDTGLRAAEPAAGIAKVEVGVGGKHRVGRWTPVRVTLRGGEAPLRGRLEARVIDGDGLPVHYVPLAGAQVEIPPRDSAEFTLYVRFGRLTADLHLQFTPSAGRPWEYRLAAPELPRAIPTETTFALCLGKGLDLREAGTRAGLGSSRLAVVELSEAGGLPTEWFGYDGIDLVVLTTAPGGPLDQLSPAQWEALETWVRLGGRLFISAGSRGGELFTPPGRLTSLAPGRFLEVAPLRRTSGLEAFAASPEPLPRGPLELAWFEPSDAVVEVVEGVGSENRPVVLRRACGLGEVVLAAIDLDRGPAAEWSGRSRLLANLLWPEGRNESPVEEGGSQGQVSHLGYDDLSGQLRGALDRFPGVGAPPFSWVAGLIVAYLLLIGPVDYFLLRRFVGRLEWTWLTFPPLVAAALALALGLGPLWRGTGPAVNQVDLLDLDLQTGLLRGTTWAHLYSPATRRFDLDLPRASAASPPTAAQPRDEEPSGARLAEPAGQLLGWQGLPGTGLGGMAGGSAAAPVSESYRIEPVEAGPRLGVRGLPLLTGSTKSVTARGWARLDPAEEAPLRWEGSQLSGAFRNPFPHELSECWLYYDRWAWPIERGLGPGERFETSLLPAPRNLEWQLVRFRIVESKDVSTPWDRSDLTNIPRILEIMMFHRAARGSSYTHLAHNHHADLDFSPLLRLRRAVLVARLPEEAAAPLEIRPRGAAEPGPPLQPAARRWTFCRLVIPVSTEPAAP